MTNQKKDSSTIEWLSNLIDDYNDNNVQIGKEKKKIYELQSENERILREISIFAANYFTKEKIIDLHTKSVEILSCNDFDEEDYINLFSDISTVKIDHIIFLFDRQKEIEKYRGVLFEDNDYCDDKKSFNVLTWFADLFRNGGGEND